MLVETAIVRFDLDVICSAKPVRRALPSFMQAQNNERHAQKVIRLATLTQSNLREKIHVQILASSALAFD
jgi:hypothetical protein